MLEVRVIETAQLRHGLRCAGQCAPKQLLAGDPERQPLKCFEQPGAAHLMLAQPELRAADFLREPGAGFANSALAFIKGAQQVAEDYPGPRRCLTWSSAKNVSSAVSG